MSQVSKHHCLTVTTLVTAFEGATRIGIEVALRKGGSGGSKQCVRLQKWS